MKKQIIVVVTLVTFLTCSEVSKAVLLGTISGQGGAMNGNASELIVTLGSTLGSGVNYISWTITPSDIGETLFISEGVDPYFEEVVSLLTNGEDNEIWRGTMIPGGIGAAHGAFESQVVSNLIGDGVDFAGYTIEEFGLTVNDCVLEPIPSWNVSYSVYGIPEPCTISLLTLGGLVLRHGAKRRAR